MPIVSILLESYCNSPEWEILPGRYKVSILLESYCNSEVLKLVKEILNSFNSPRVLLQPTSIYTSMGVHTAVSILLESYCNEELTYILIPAKKVSILLESYCNFSQGLAIL